MTDFIFNLVLHYLRIVPPIQSLEVISSQDVDVRVSGHVGEEDDLLGVARLEQGLHGLQAISGLGPLLRGQMVAALSASD